MTDRVAAQDGVTLSGVALDTVDDNRFFTRVGGTVRDDVTYDGLTAGQPYTLAAQLFSLTTEDVVGDIEFVTFTPDAAAGTVSVELPVPQNRTEFNIDYVVLATLYEGEVDPATADDSAALAKLDDTANLDQTIQSHAIQSISVTAADAADGDQSLAPEGGTISADVEFINLVEGYKYTIWGQLLTPSGQTAGVFASIPEYIPDEKNGSVTLEFEVPEGFDGIKLAPTVGLYHQNRVELHEDGSLSWLPDAPMPVMIASDLSVDAEEQTIKIGVPFEEQ
ncbi:VaFE repeat-containing surface-anchored protein [Aliiroseovarius sp. YM-037]|uniref:VaFE repeat-containing surface-anchored protein n=1 Tax=Aliiroseovarius sp. YM-037 TaxID=3341728 RepID=UPI003A80E69A